MNDAESVSLREHIERLLLEQDKRYEQRFQAQEKAVRIALEAVDRSHNRTVWLAGLSVTLASALIQMALHLLVK